MKTKDGIQRFNRVNPLLKAYLLGYLSSTAPRILGVAAQLTRNKLRLTEVLDRLSIILREATAINRFPTFCAVLVGGSTLLQIPFLEAISACSRILSRQKYAFTPRLHALIARFLAALIAASVSFKLINSKACKLPNPIHPKGNKVTTRVQNANDLDYDVLSLPPLPSEPLQPQLLNLPPEAFAGRTIDLTLFAVIRALDIVISSFWTNHVPQTHIARFASKASIPLLFTFSSATIMHTWFYSPDRLPRSYNSWITQAAQIDERLLFALRHARYGNFIYGKDTGMAPLLGSLCRECNLPEVWGDPAKTIPVPCEVVHMGTASSCEAHAMYRFWRGWLFATKTYAPLHLLLLLRTLKRQPQTHLRLSLAFLRTIWEIARSSSFLGAFISLFYYGVCLSRTRLGPLLFNRQKVTPQMWDSGLCILAGCMMCGWSLLIERPRRRIEMALFVLPRAIACWLPRIYLKKDQWKEHLAFTLSTAVVFTAVQENPALVRGMLGRLLHNVLGS